MSTLYHILIYYVTHAALYNNKEWEHHRTIIKYKKIGFQSKLFMPVKKTFVQFISVKNITKYVKSHHRHGVNIVKIILLVKSMLAPVKCEKEASMANNCRLISQDISLMHRSKNTSVHLRQWIFWPTNISVASSSGFWMVIKLFIRYVSTKEQYAKTF